MTKAELRKHYLSLQKSFSPAEREGRSRKIAKNIFNSFDFSAVRLLHCFLSMEKFNEVDTSQIFHGLWKEFPQTRTVVPRVNFETNEIESVPYSAETELVENLWNIREPLHEEIVDPETIDMVLVPGLAFDTLGHRVGYGKGFYDRFLAKCRPDCTKTGLSYFEPVEAIKDIHAADIQLDHIVTPDRIYGTGNGSSQPPLTWPSEYP